MILPDVNVLIYALRSDADQHAVSRKWLNSYSLATTNSAYRPSS